MKISLTSLTKRKIIFSVCLLLLAAAFIFILSDLEGLNNKYTGVYAFFQKQLNERLIAATKIFAITKVVAGTLSFLQNIRIDFNVIIAGLAVSPLSVIEPISYTINNISNLFLLAMGAIILEKILLAAGSFLALKVLFPLGISLRALSIWLSGIWHERVKSLSFIIMIFGAVIWLTIPISGLISAGLEKYFLNDIISSASNELDNQAKSMGGLEKDLSTPEGWVGSETNSSWFNRAKDSLSLSNIQKKLADISNKAVTSAKAMLENMIRIFVVFFVTTVVMPVGTMLGLWIFLKRFVFTK